MHLRMQRLYFALTIGLLSSINTADGQLITFLRNDSIWVKDLKNKVEHVFCKGYDPDISPDGKEIAFTAYKNGGRQIGIINVETKQLRYFNSIPGNNTYGPKWSLDGSHIAVNHYTDSRWSICVTNRNGTDFTFLSNSQANNIFSPTWYMNEFVVCHDMKSLFMFDMHGKVKYTQSLNSMGENIGEASSCEIYLSNDSLSLLYNGTIEKPLSKDFLLPDGRQTTIYIYNIKTKRSARISPNGIYALRPRWVNKHDVIYEGFTKNDIRYRNGEIQFIKRHIYYYTSSSMTSKIIVENGYMPSYSTYH